MSPYAIRTITAVLLIVSVLGPGFWLLLRRDTRDWFRLAARLRAEHRRQES
jgi:hypothetical protein